jgi:dolichol-phosphate mannosyltransferase
MLELISDVLPPGASKHLKRIPFFLVGGGSAAALNLLLAYVGVDLLGFSSHLEQNVVNFVVMEISLVYSFFVYRALVWQVKGWNLSRVFLRQLPLYHLSAGSAVLTRLVLFPFFQALGLHYLVNIVLGILAGMAMNYFLSDRYVFKGAVGEEGS